MWRKNMAERTNEERQHTLHLIARGGADVEGVIEVRSFDEETVILKTSCGEMTLEGEGLRVGGLDLTEGRLRVDGRINAVCYSDAIPQRRGWRDRLLGR
jgi:sporulation protein YabP